MGNADPNSCRSIVWNYKCPAGGCKGGERGNCTTNSYQPENENDPNLINAFGSETDMRDTAVYTRTPMCKNYYDFDYTEYRSNPIPIIIVVALVGLAIIAFICSKCCKKKTN